MTDVLANAVDDPWWRETTLLYAARADADSIVAACLNSGTITSLALAFDCADQGSAFAEELRDRLENFLVEASDPTTSQERRHLIIGVLLARHLRQQFRTSDGTRICIRAITANLYQFFRDDTHTPAPDGQQSTKPATELASGMRAADATAFADWVTLSSAVRSPIVCPAVSRWTTRKRDDSLSHRRPLNPVGSGPKSAIRPPNYGSLPEYQARIR